MDLEVGIVYENNSLTVMSLGNESLHDLWWDSFKIVFSRMLALRLYLECRLYAFIL